jgi:hypothetical protein
MKTRRKDGSITTGSDWDEVSFTPIEFLVLALFAGIGVIATLDYMAKHFG